MEFSVLSAYISQLSILIPVIFFIAKKGNIKNPNLKILGIYLFASVLFDLVGYVSAKLFHSNVIVLNLYFPVQFFLIGWMYWRFYEAKKEKKEFIKIGILIFAVFFIINTAFIQGPFVYQSYTNSVSSGILLFFAFRFFNVIHRLPVKVPQKLGTPVKDVEFMTLYFINMGVFIYFSLNFWLFTVSPPFLELFNEQGMFNLWTCHNVLNIVKNLLFAGSIYYARKKDLE